ncbi:MAG: class I SAM-dependent methyltransferase [Planctomycetes bacterium]|nr:class I SAM-dependent methyltransferase [Planctomycetota bacterium]
MERCVSETCEAIAGPQGRDLLQLMRKVYYGTHHYGALPRDIRTRVEMAEGLGLLSRRGPWMSLTTAGYLVGNVAKEYCNWLDARRDMPPPRPGPQYIEGKDVVDVGCSYGRWLWSFQQTARSAVGIELQPEFIALGEALARLENVPVPRMLQGDAESVHQLLPSESADLVFSRLVFNAVTIDRALQSAATCLRPGGVLWLQVEPFSHLLVLLGRRRDWRRPRTLAHHALAVGNSLLYTAIGRQVQLRSPGRMHSVHRPAYPTVGRWRRAMEKAGLVDFRVEHDQRGLLALSARKPPCAAACLAIGGGRWWARSRPRRRNGPPGSLKLVE